MITSFDDYCIHQTALPIAEPSQSDRNFYDRYWFNGFDDGGNYLFEIGFGLYPNRRVMDGHFSVAIGNKQYAFHASRRAPKDRRDTSVGPLSITIEEPIRQVRVKLEANEHKIECDLLFTAASIPHREPANVMHDDGHLIMHTTRFTQIGYWSGYFSIDGERYDVSKAYGTRDKSWGVRPVGEPQQGGAPGLMNSEPGVYWIWNPINWGDFCTQMGSFEDRDGNPTQVSADLVPLYDNLQDIPEGEDPGMIAMTEVKHQVRWNKGTRMAAGCDMQFKDKHGNSYDISMEPLQRFYMLGIGYNHFEWGHAYWKGELATGREDWNLDEINPLDYQFIHAHQVVRATMGDKVGMGTLETIAIGRHAPSGFKDYFDGAE